MLLRKIEINYQNTTSLVNDLITVTYELENEKESVKRALDELNDLENYHANKGVIVDELEFRKRKIDKDIQNTEELIQNIKDFSERVQETDERLAQKFKQDIKSYAKKNNIELVSELDKFLKKAEMALDALGLVPGIGEVADGINGILSLLQGNWGNALISFGSMVPLAGDSLKGLKYLDEASDLLKMGDKVVDLEKSSKKLSKATKNLDIKDIDFKIDRKLDVNKTSKKIEGYDGIERFRKKAGLKPYSIDSGDTVASVSVNNKTYFGVNSTITKESQKASKELRQKWFKEIEWVPPKKSQPKHLGHAQSLTHAESHALIRAFERQGKLPKNVTMYVDRKTCNICRGELPAILKRLGVEELEIYSGGITDNPIIIKAIK